MKRLLRLDVNKLAIQEIDSDVNRLSLGSNENELYYFKEDHGGRAEVYKNGKIVAKASHDKTVFTCIGQFKNKIIIGGFDSQDHEQWKANYELVVPENNKTQNFLLTIPMEESYDEIPLAIRMFSVRSRIMAVACRCSASIDLILATRKKLVFLQSVTLKLEVYNSSLLVECSDRIKAQVLIATEESVESIKLHF